MKAFFLLVLLTGFVAPASARIGDTQAQLIQRYGAPVSHGGSDSIPAMIFNFNGWLVTCDLVSGVCVRLSYAKTGEWTEETFEKLLGANGVLAEWADLGAPSMKKLQRIWKREDGTTATWVVGCLSITSPRYEKAKATSETEALMAAAHT